MASKARPVEREVGSEIMRGIIEALNSVSIKAAKRRAIYALMFEVFEDVGYNSFEDNLSSDETIDKAYDSAYNAEYE